MLTVHLDAETLRPLIDAAVIATLARVQSADTPEQWRTIPQAAEILALGETKVREFIAQGRLRSVLVDTARRIPDSAIKEFQSRFTGSGEGRIG